MRIVFIHRWHSEGMGYTDNMLPPALAKLGHEVHLITGNTQIYFDTSTYKEIYEPFFGPGITACGVKEANGVTIHRLPYYDFCPFKSMIHRFEGYGLKGLYQYIDKLKPDIIQTFDVQTVYAYYAANWVKVNGGSLFTESHLHKSVFNLKNKELWAFYNRFNPILKKINYRTAKHYAIAQDVADISRSYYRIPKKKIKVQSLGVDTDLFKAVTAEEKIKLRGDMGFTGDELILIYTGRITQSKNPMILADAIDILNEEGISAKGIFIGNGERQHIDYIKSKSNTRVLDFMPMQNLKEYYQLSDIGVWPREESTAQLDAMACGLPLVLSNSIKVQERIEGNGLLYEEGNPVDLARKIRDVQEMNNNNKLGRIAMEKIISGYSWDYIARERVRDYEESQKQL